MPRAAAYQHHVSRCRLSCHPMATVQVSRAKEVVLVSSMQGQQCAAMSKLLWEWSSPAMIVAQRSIWLSGSSFTRAEQQCCQSA